MDTQPGSPHRCPLLTTTYLTLRASHALTEMYFVVITNIFLADIYTFVLDTSVELVII